jgi:hypothetical protein
MDMCHNIQEGEGTSVVNLALNPERNTGYNGTHIWNAIYEENCLTVDERTEFEKGVAVSRGGTATCFEERVLYRLLSGMQ